MVTVDGPARVVSLKTQKSFIQNFDIRTNKFNISIHELPQGFCEYMLTHKTKRLPVSSVPTDSNFSRPDKLWPLILCWCYFDPTHCTCPTYTPCLITYWRHGLWLDAISCPLCRQKVSVLCHLFNEKHHSDRQSKAVLGQITDYNRRYSGAPRTVTDYLCDAPLLLQLMARGLGAMGGLLWLFFFRVALCCVGTVVSISSPPLEPIPSSAGPLESDPSLCGLLGVLDDLVVVILLLICVINVNQHMAEQRGRDTNVATTRTVIGNFR